MRFSNWILVLVANYLVNATTSYTTFFCQPQDESCWPSQQEIDLFESSLSSASDDSESCLVNVPTFTSKAKQGFYMFNHWYPDESLVLTPWRLLNFRNFIQDQKAYFVVLARNGEDVSLSIRFAVQHNLSIALMGTGHELQDRNAGSGPNGLLVRTVCLRSVDIDLDPNNRFLHSDGVARLGAGLTWGTSKLGMTGVHEMAAGVGRVAVSGHAAQVGVVGWSMGGGHSPLAPLYGLGVDQMLEVELVGADGSTIIANANGTHMKAPGEHSQWEYSQNSDLFWAMRGGGGGTWGAVTALTIKLHRPRNDCHKDCYHVHNIVWTGSYKQDDMEMAQNLLETYLQWVTTTSKYWTSYFTLFAGPAWFTGQYKVVIGDAMYVGKASEDGDIGSLEDTFRNKYPDQLSNWHRATYDTFFDKTGHQGPETVHVGAASSVISSVFLNESILVDPLVSKTLVDLWLPSCYRQNNPADPCVESYLIHQTLPIDDDLNTDTAVSRAFREARVHVKTGSATNILEDLTEQQKEDYVHRVLGPQIYQFGSASYYSESEYSLSPGQWQNRFWGQENYDKLLNIKNTWDPEHIFGCRHCIGDEEQPQAINNSTMPPWRHSSYTMFT